ncbi:MAG: ABC transporter ATP-binding protein [Thiotrichales bacterium]
MIKTEQLTRRYGAFTAVDEVSFEIGAGEVVGLLGHNGAGKTTIMKMLTGYLEPSAGDIVIDGERLASHRRAAQRKIGYLPENCPTYPEMTVVDYLAYAAALHGVASAARPRALRSAIKRTALGEKAGALIATLSRGFRQRVGVAQAILHAPRILILDEPTNGLDPSQIQHMRDLIRELSRDTTVILSTHILQEVEAVCDRAIIIRNGRIALDAPLAELQRGGRLVVGLDAAPEHCRDALTALGGVSAVETLPSTGTTWHYALMLDAGVEANAAAPAIARALFEQGFALSALQTERRDLETVFREINLATGEAPHA